MSADVLLAAIAALVLWAGILGHVLTVAVRGTKAAAGAGAAATENPGNMRECMKAQGYSA